MHKVILSRQAIKDLEKLKQAGLSERAEALTKIVGNNPYQTPPIFEKLVGDLSGCYSRRINIQHRFVYRLFPNDENFTDSNGEPYEGIVHVLRMWTHYE
ncbi:addiction module protein [Synergistales bacterium]|nr:addiction module protein [Synergistales bacterium]